MGLWDAVKNMFNSGNKALIDEYTSPANRANNRSAARAKAEEQAQSFNSYTDPHQFSRENNREYYARHPFSGPREKFIETYKDPSSQIYSLYGSQEANGKKIPKYNSDFEINSAANKLFAASENVAKANKKLSDYNNKGNDNSALGGIFSLMGQGYTDAYQGLPGQANPQTFYDELTQLNGAAGFVDENGNPIPVTKGNLDEMTEKYMSNRPTSQSGNPFSDYEEDGNSWAYNDWERAAKKAQKDQEVVDRNDLAMRNGASAVESSRKAKLGQERSDAVNTYKNLLEEAGVSDSDYPSMTSGFDKEQTAESETEPETTENAMIADSGKKPSGGSGDKQPSDAAADEIEAMEAAAKYVGEDGTIDMDLLIKDSIAEGSNTLWTDPEFLDILERNGWEDVYDADIYQLIQQMSEEQFKQFARDPFLYDNIYRNAYYINENGDRVGLTITNNDDWDTWIDWSTGLSLEEAIANDDWATVADIIGAGTSASTEALDWLTGYNPESGEWSIGEDGRIIAPWDFGSPTSDVEQLLSDFNDQYGWDYGSAEDLFASPQDFALFTRMYADALGRSIAEDVNSNVLYGANTGNMVYDDSGLLTDIVPVDEGWMPGYFDSMGYSDR